MFEKLNKTQKYGLHILFWFAYYILFSLIWVKGGDYKSSFYLEFILLPVRLFVVYFTILYLIPQFLVKKRFKKFLGIYVLTLIIGGIAQRFALYYFFENETGFYPERIFNIYGIIRAVILLNTTAILVSSVKILSLYFREKEKREDDDDKNIELKSNRRTYLIRLNDIKYVEGMGNYVMYHLTTGKNIVVYQSLKKCLSDLPDHFLRVHKSYIVNIDKIVSYDSETVEVTSGELVPVSKTSRIIAVLES